MDAEDTQTARRASRKSVAFTEEKLVVDADGKITMVASPDDDHKDTAMSHAPSTPPLAAALEASADAAKEEPNGDLSAPAAQGDDDSVDLGLLKKKKKKVKVVTQEDEAADGEGEDDAVLDLTKKKKKRKPKADDEDAFAAKLAAMNMDKEGGEEEPEQEEQAGDMDEGTGIWQHDETNPIAYNPLLSRFFALLTKKNPDHASGGVRSYKIPPPQCMREGNKKTIFANIPEICKRMNRPQEHVTAFLLTELGTNGNVTGNNSLVIKGRFQSKQLETVLRKYIIDYVTCKTCRSPETSLSKGENRLYFITCLSCGSRRSVQAIKTGFSAQVGKRKKMQG